MEIDVQCLESPKITYNVFVCANDDCVCLCERKKLLKRINIQPQTFLTRLQTYNERQNEQIYKIEINLRMRLKIMFFSSFEHQFKILFSIFLLDCNIDSSEVLLKLKK